MKATGNCPCPMTPGILKQSWCSSPSHLSHPVPHSLGWAAGFTSVVAHSCTQGSLGPCMLAWRQGVPQSRCAGVQSAGYLSTQREKSKADEAIPGPGMERRRPCSSTQLLPPGPPPSRQLMNGPAPPHLARFHLLRKSFSDAQGRAHPFSRGLLSGCSCHCRNI